MGPVLVLAHVDVAPGEGLPGGRVAGRGGVLLLERLVAPVVGWIGGEVRTAGCLCHPVSQQTVDDYRTERTLVGEGAVVHNALRRDKPAIGRPEEQGVEEGIGPED